MSNSLLNGHGSTVDSPALADLFSAFIGKQDCISSVGSKMTAAIQSDNAKVRVQDGVCFSEGLAISIDAGTYEDFTIPNGTQGTTATYYIGFHITKSASTGAHSVEKVVSATKTAAATSIRNGGNEQYIWLYSAVRNGVELASVNAEVPTIYPGTFSFGTAAPDNNDGMPVGHVYFQIEG